MAKMMRIKAHMRKKPGSRKKMRVKGHMRKGMRK